MSTRTSEDGVESSKASSPTTASQSAATTSSTPTPSRHLQPLRRRRRAGVDYDATLIQGIAIPSANMPGRTPTTSTSATPPAQLNRVTTIDKRTRDIARKNLSDKLDFMKTLCEDGNEFMLCVTAVFAKAWEAMIHRRVKDEGEDLNGYRDFIIEALNLMDAWLEHWDGPEDSQGWTGRKNFDLHVDSICTEMPTDPRRPADRYESLRESKRTLIRGCIEGIVALFPPGDPMSSINQATLTTAWEARFWQDAYGADGNVNIYGDAVEDHLIDLREWKEDWALNDQTESGQDRFRAYLMRYHQTDVHLRLPTIAPSTTATGVGIDDDAEGESDEELYRAPSPARSPYNQDANNNNSPYYLPTTPSQDSNLEEELYDLAGGNDPTSGAEDKPEESPDCADLSLEAIILKAFEDDETVDPSLQACVPQASSEEMVLDPALGDHAVIHTSTTPIAAQPITSSSQNQEMDGIDYHRTVEQLLITQVQEHAPSIIVAVPVEDIEMGESSTVPPPSQEPTTTTATITGDTEMGEAASMPSSSAKDQIVEDICMTSDELPKPTAGTIIPVTEISATDTKKVQFLPGLVAGASNIFGTDPKPASPAFPPGVATFGGFAGKPVTSTFSVAPAPAPTPTILGGIAAKTDHPEAKAKLEVKKPIFGPEGTKVSSGPTGTKPASNPNFSLTGIKFGNGLATTIPAPKSVCDFCGPIPDFSSMLKRGASKAAIEVPASSSEIAKNTQTEEPATPVTATETVDCNTNNGDVETPAVENQADAPNKTVSTSPVPTKVNGVSKEPHIDEVSDELLTAPNETHVDKTSAESTIVFETSIKEVVSPVDRFLAAMEELKSLRACLSTTELDHALKKKRNDDSDIFGKDDFQAGRRLMASIKKIFKQPSPVPLNTKTTAPVVEERRPEVETPQKVEDSKYEEHIESKTQQQPVAKAAEMMPENSIKATDNAPVSAVQSATKATEEKPGSATTATEDKPEVKKQKCTDSKDKEPVGGKKQPDSENLQEEETIESSVPKASPRFDELFKDIAVSKNLWMKEYNFYGTPRALINIAEELLTHDPEPSVQNTTIENLEVIARKWEQLLTTANHLKALREAFNGDYDATFRRDAYKFREYKLVYDTYIYKASQGTQTRRKYYESEAQNQDAAGMRMREGVREELHELLGMYGVYLASLKALQQLFPFHEGLEHMSSTSLTVFHDLIEARHQAFMFPILPFPRKISDDLAVDDAQRALIKDCCADPMADAAYDQLIARANALKFD
ncbi:hypothetical protein A1F96_02272 [Pyrenophora tritici-repentis]|nr:hypothetical protein A1F96_02272 [Pyrenophora tritici-repentis]